MAKPKSIHVILSLLIIFTTALTSNASERSNLPSSSKWAPRFLGKYSHLTKPNFRQPQIRYETRYYDQSLDHFSFSELPRFRQRYLISTEYWVGPQRMGPIFLYCGNEGDIAWFAENTGFVWEIAPRFGAMVLFPEVKCFFFFFLAFSLLCLFT